MSDTAEQSGIVETTETLAGNTAAVEVDATEEVAPLEAEADKVATEADPVKAEEDRRFAAKFAALTKREKALREKEKALTLRMKELEAKVNQQSTSAPAAKEEPLELRIKRDPFKTLEQLGVNYETLTRIALNDGKLTPELQMQLMREELDGKYKTELDDIRNQLKTRDDRETAAKEEQAIASFKNDIGSNISSDRERYELLSVEGQDGIDLVFNIIDEHYKETSEILEMSVALDAAEEGLLDEAKKRIELGKIKKLLGASQKLPETKDAAPQATAAKKETPTLSNQKAQVQPTKSRFLSDEESKAQAAKLIRWNN